VLDRNHSGRVKIRTDRRIAQIPNFLRQSWILHRVASAFGCQSTKCGVQFYGAPLPQAFAGGLTANGGMSHHPLRHLPRLFARHQQEGNTRTRRTAREKKKGERFATWVGAPDEPGLWSC